MVVNFNYNNNSKITLDQCKSSTLFSNVIAQSSDPGTDPGPGVECNCGLIWGTGCSSSNYGNTCWTGDFCSDGAANCND